MNEKDKLYDELLFNADKYIDGNKETFNELTQSTDYDEIKYILVKFREIEEFNKLLKELNGESIFDLNEFINYIININGKNKLYDELLFNADKYIDGNKETFHELSQSTDYDEIKYILVRFREIEEFNKLLKELNGESIFDLNEFINYIIKLNSVNESKDVTKKLDENKSVKATEKDKLYDELLFNADKYIDGNKETFNELTKSTDYDEIKYILVRFREIGEFNKLLKEFNGESIFDLNEFINYIIKSNSVNESKDVKLTKTDISKLPKGLDDIDEIRPNRMKKPTMYGNMWAPDKLYIQDEAEQIMQDKYGRERGTKTWKNSIGRGARGNAMFSIANQIIREKSFLFHYLNIDKKTMADYFSISYYAMWKLWMELEGHSYKITNNEAKPANITNKNVDEIIADMYKSVKPAKKDYDRIMNITNRANDDEAKELKLATNMARSIKDANKAFKRFRAAEEENFHQIAGIFYQRTIDLLSQNESINERKLTVDEIEYFKFLNYLRDNGITNMYGASPYLVDTFDLDKKEARNVLALWMNNFNEDENTYNDLEIED